MKSIANVLQVSILIASVFFVGLSIRNNNLPQIAFAQFPPGGTFSVKGFTGQVLVLPTGLSQLPSPGHPVAPPIGSILGGNWSFNVSNGRLQNFKWNVNAITLSGRVNGSLSVNKLTNVTGATREYPHPSIILHGNNTSFLGYANVDINGKPMFTNVPAAVHLINGKIVNFHVTNNAFPFPFFGIVTSLTKP